MPMSRDITHGAPNLSEADITHHLAPDLWGQETTMTASAPPTARHARSWLPSV